MKAPEEISQRAPAEVPVAKTDLLLPYQKKWVEDTSPLKCAEKSRRIGLTWANASEDVLLASQGKKSGGMDCWYIAPNKDMALEYILDVANWARFFRVAVSEVEEGFEIFKDGDEKESILVYKVNFASGHRVSALSSRPRNLRGKQGKVTIDEAAFHDNLGELLKAALALLMWGGRVAVISTHDGVDNDFNRLVQEIREGKRPGSLHRTTITDALADGLYRRICLVLGRQWSPEAEREWLDELVAFYGDGADEELFCVPRRSGGVYLSMTVIEARAREGIPVIRLALDDDFIHRPEITRRRHIEDWCERELLPVIKALPAGLDYAAGEDFGRSVDLTVLTILAILKNLSRQVCFAVELSNVPFTHQEQIVFYVLDRIPHLRKGAFDARGNGQALAENAALRYGAGRIEQVMFSDAFYLENMPRFKAAFDDGMIEIPADSLWVSDLNAFRVIDGVPKLPKQKTHRAASGSRHGDAGISLFLGHYASCMDAVEIDYRRASPYGESRRGGSWKRDMDEWGRDDTKPRTDRGGFRSRRGVL